MTLTEAAALEAGDEQERDAAMAALQERHVRARLAPAVDSGILTADQAQLLVEQVRAGGDSRELRARINELARAAGSTPTENS